MLTSVEYLLGTRYCAKHLTHIIVLFSVLYRWRNWNSERSDNILRVTQLERDRSRIRTQICLILVSWFLTIIWYCKNIYSVRSQRVSHSLSLAVNSRNKLKISVIKIIGILAPFLTRVQNTWILGPVLLLSSCVKLGHVTKFP